MKTNLEQVRQIISLQLGIDTDEATPEALLVDDLDLDSLDEIELIMALEDAYNIQISDADAEKLRTVQDVVNYLEKHAKAAK